MNDPTWLDLYEHNQDCTTNLSARHYKFPTISRLSFDDNTRLLADFDFYKEYEQTLGNYINLYSLSVRDSRLNVDKHTVNVYMVKSHRDQMLSSGNDTPAWLHTIQAGCAMTKIRNGDFFDDVGDNISAKNQHYAEMTAIYWLWKNQVDCEYLGICHYRRHFDLSNHNINQIIANDIDGILTTPRLVLNGIRETFIQDTPVTEAVFAGMIEAIRNICGNDVAVEAEAYFNRRFYYPNNMFIAKNKIFNEYCSWIFPILNEMEKVTCLHADAATRYIAYAAEMLTSFYFAVCKDKYKIAVAEYKLIL